MTTVITQLLAAARAADHRRLLVLAGDRRSALDRLDGALSPWGEQPPTLVAPAMAYCPECWVCVEPDRARELLGATREVVAVDLHYGLFPSVLGALVGVVKGGGLLVLLTPELDRWPHLPDQFRQRLLSTADRSEETGNRFVRRFIRSLCAAPGVTVVDAVSGAPLAHQPPDAPLPRPQAVSGTGAPSPFLAPGLAACRTPDQEQALTVLGHLREADRPAAVVLESDRGRGKSSVLGLFAGLIAAAGGEVTVTGPTRAAVVELFGRAREILERRDPPVRGSATWLRAGCGGRIRFVPPLEAAEGRHPILLVDEAAALPVPLLKRLLATARRAAFATTVHGYEGTGRGFALRFRRYLDRSDYRVWQVHLQQPVRWSAGDPVERWAFSTLLLDAAPREDAFVAGARPEACAYRAPTPEELLADEPLLRQIFGLLVLAHYRTRPDDLARLLDAPNVRIRALTWQGSVVAAALLSREGSLPDGLCTAVCAGHRRLRGNMVPETLMAHAGERRAGRLHALRIMRIAVHPAIRTRDLGRHLVDRIHQEVGREEVDYMAAAFAASPDLVQFWTRVGYHPVRVGLTRSKMSGEHSTILLHPLSPAGREMTWDLVRRFTATFPDQLAAGHFELEPTVAPTLLAAARRAL